LGSARKIRFGQSGQASQARRFFDAGLLGPATAFLLAPANASSLVESLVHPCDASQGIIDGALPSGAFILEIFHDAGGKAGRNRSLVGAGLQCGDAEDRRRLWSPEPCQ
jgi:hypothetical protein